MPTIQPITNTVIPKTTEPPIPVRTVITRAPSMTPKNTVQQVNNSQSAESATTEESVRLSPQLSALARKEQAYRQKEQALKAREKEIESKLADAERFSSLKNKFGEKDFSEAESMGLNYEEYTKYLLDKQNGEDPVQSEIKRLNAEIESLKKGNEDSAVQQFDQTIAEYKNEIARLVSEDENFSTIKGFNKQDAVLKLIVDTFEEDGEELTINEAAKLVEEELSNIGNSFLDLPKFKREEILEQPRTLPRPMVGKTLTNDMTVSSEKRPYKSLQHLSEAERYAEARRRVLERREKGK